MGQCIVVIPAYNEQATIGYVVKEARKYCDVIVVDDCSKDQTSEIAGKNGARVLRNKQNLGYDSTLNKGITEAVKRAPVVIILDADGQHDPRDIPNMLSLIKKGKADFVVGIRPKKARLSEKIYAMFTKRYIGISDPLCGFKAFRSEIFEKVGYYDSMKSIGTEFMFAAKKLGYKLAETKITLNKRQDIPRFSMGNKLKAETAIFSAMVRVIIKYAL